MKRIAVVGCGLVGASWGVVFARAGHEVALYDPSTLSIESAIDYARQALADLSERDLLNGCDPGVAASRLQPAESLAQALDEVEYVQESAPERLSVKQSIYPELARLTNETTILASSTSGLPASSFVDNLDARDRCIVAHPINPPHLIPLIEIVPSPWTLSETVARTMALMRSVGQRPIQLHREINGFVVNRLQSAVLAEAFRLVEDGIASVDDVDMAICEGLGLRWFFMGPFETIDLNAVGGVADYCRKLGPMYYSLAKEQADPRPWGEKLVAEVEAQRRSLVPQQELEARRVWRDRALVGLVAAKRQLLEELG